MGSRKMREDEIAHLQELLAEARNKLSLQQQYVTALEQELADGTVWELDFTAADYQQIEADAKAFNQWLDQNLIRWEQALKKEEIMDTMFELTDREIARALEKQQMFKGMNLEDAVDEGDRLIAKAQVAKVLSMLEPVKLESPGEVELGVEKVSQVGRARMTDKEPATRKG